MPRKSREVERGLRAKGFDVLMSKHVRFRYVTRAGRKTEVRTAISHGANRDISDPLLAEMSRQLGLTRRQFNDLVDCPLSRVGYERILAERGLMPR